VQLLWSQSLSASLLGLSLSRERGVLLVWDRATAWLLSTLQGQTEARWQAPSPLNAASCAEDGSTVALGGRDGQVWLLPPDFVPLWHQSVAPPVRGLALDPHAKYLAVADGKGTLHLFDRVGRLRTTFSTPRPLRHLSFIPEWPGLVASADFGLVACFDFAGRCLWRDSPVAHVGALAVTGNGQEIALACFSEGLGWYTSTGSKPTSRWIPPPCRLVGMSYTGEVLLTAGLTPEVELRQADGLVKATFPTEDEVIGLAVAPLGDHAYLALAGGSVLALDLT
jgi:WD40 repeat protein